MLLRITWPRSLALSIALPSSGGCPDCLFPIFNRVSVSRTVTIDRTSLLWTDPAFDCHLTHNRVSHVKQSRITPPHTKDTLRTPCFLILREHAFPINTVTLCLCPLHKMRAEHGTRLRCTLY